MSEAEKIKDQYRKMYEGMIRKDQILLEEALDDQFILTHMTGLRQNRNEYVQAIEQGTLNYYEVTHDNIYIKLHGDTADILGQSQVTASVFGGVRSDWKLQLSGKAIKSKGKWKIKSLEATTY